MGAPGSDPNPSDRERTVLTHALRVARSHVIDQVADLPEGLRRRSVVPSGWTPIGLVRHLTLSDERYWFDVVVAGGPLDFWPAEPDGDWRVGTEESTDDVLAAYGTAIARSDEVIAATALGDPPRGPRPEWDEAGRFADLRAILSHVVVETSTHAGQLDVVRELLDGKRYIVLQGSSRGRRRPTP